MAGVYERDGQWWAVPKPVPLTRVIRSALLNALAFTNGHQGQAAQLLELTPRQMSYQLRINAIPSDHKKQSNRRRRRLRIAPRRTA